MPQRLLCRLHFSLPSRQSLIVLQQGEPHLNFLADGNLTALNKPKPDSPLDIQPNAARETFSLLIESALAARAAEFFQSQQFGVACPFGTEKIAHGLRSCIEENCMV